MTKIIADKCTRPPTGDRSKPWKPSDPTYKPLDGDWSLVVATGKGQSAVSTDGTTTLWAGSLWDTPTRVGTVDGVCSGARIRQIGKNVGKLAKAYVWSRVLSEVEIANLWTQTRDLTSHGFFPGDPASLYALPHCFVGYPVPTRDIFVPCPSMLHTAELDSKVVWGQVVVTHSQNVSRLVPVHLEHKLAQ